MGVIVCVPCMGIHSLLTPFYSGYQTLLTLLHPSLLKKKKEKKRKEM
jgi:hypothetical protein